MNYVGVGLVLVALLGGIALGFVPPLRLAGHRPGFTAGVLAGGLFSVGSSMPVAFVAAGWGEELLGLDVGVPVGLFLGCLGWTTAFNFVAFDRDFGG
jgi:hypothetical protein